MTMRKLWFTILSLVLIIGFSLAMTHQAVAQAAEVPGDGTTAVAVEKEAVSTTTEQTLSVREILGISGWPMYLLIAVSFVAAAFVVYFFCVLRTQNIAPLSLRKELSTTLNSGALGEARTVCSNRPCPLAAVTVAALDYLKTVPNADSTLLKDIIQSEGARQAEALRGPIRHLMDIVGVAPMIGLLGTVLGMVRAFRGVALDEAMARPVVLANGVQQALYTTAAGLIIAIPAAIFYAFFRRRANALVSQLEEASTEILMNLLKKSD